MSIPSPPSSEGMRDCFFTTLFSLGEAWVKHVTNLEVLNIASCIYYIKGVVFRQPLKDEHLYLTSVQAANNINMLPYK